MDKILDATYDGEVFRPDEPVDLASNTKVKVVIEEEPKKLKLVEKPKKGKGEPYAFLKYLESVSIDAPPDYASNLDEYLYGGKSLK
ncbi:MAG: antitoxin family protein [Acidobacteriota bacterium]